MYEDGLGVARSRTEALNWYTKAANARLPEAMHELASIYRTGRLGPTDPVAGYMWLILALRHGDPDAADDREPFAAGL